MPNSVRWGVVGTMDEPAPLILAWAAHHLSIGAAEVHIFLDRANPAVADALADIPNAYVTLCDETYWAASSRNERPIRHTARQKYNATHVYQTRELDWVVQVDADEFLSLSDDFTDELAQSTARTLRLQNWERVRNGAADDLFSGSFRGPNSDTEQLATTHGRWADFLDAGMAGYHDGKDIVRCGQAFTMGVHFPIDTTTNERNKDPVIKMQSARILHFDGLTPLHIILKLMKRATEPKYAVPRKFGPQRDRQIRFARNHMEKPKQLQKMVAAVFGLTNQQMTALGSSHSSTSFDPSPALAQFGIAADLSCAAFDSHLKEREAELIAKTGLQWPA